MNIMKINNIHIYGYLILAFIILIWFDNSFFLDFIPRQNNNLDLLYGKEIPVFGGTLFLDIISNIIPNAIFQKFILFSILFLSSFTSYKLMTKIIDSKISSLYAGLIYMINPFVYIRTLVGQWYISYAVLPLSIKFFIEFLENSNKKRMIKLESLMFIVAFNIHLLIITLIIFFLIKIFWILKYKSIKIRPMIILGILFLLLNSYWIIPLLTTNNTIINNIGEKDFDMFDPKGGFFDIAAMYGFWREGYIYGKDFIFGWQILFLLILGLSIFGLINYYKDKKIGIFVRSFAVIGIIGFLLAIGENGPFRWLFENTILIGFRDSQKFVIMIILAYSMLGGLGIEAINKLRKNG